MVVIQRRGDELTTWINQHSTPIDTGLSVAVHHQATESGGYCERGDDIDWFSISVAAQDDLISGTIDGVFNCNQKVWGPIDVKGRTFKAAQGFVYPAPLLVVKKMVFT